MNVQTIVLDIPDANPVSGARVSLVRRRDGAELAATTTGADGIAALQADGNCPADLTVVRGAEVRALRLDLNGPAGPMDWSEMPRLHQALAPNGGVLPGIGGGLRVSVGLPAGMLAISSGMALTPSGWAYRQYATKFLAVTPPSGNRVDLVTVAEGPGDGETSLALVTGTETSGTPAAPALPATSVELARVTLTGGAVAIDQTQRRWRLDGNGAGAMVVGVVRAVTTVPNQNGSLLDVPAAQTDVTLASGIAYQIEAQAHVNPAVGGWYATSIDGTGSPGTECWCEPGVWTEVGVTATKTGSGAGVDCHLLGRSNSASAGLAGTFVRAYGASDLALPRHVALDASDNRYVVDGGHALVRVYSSSGSLVRSFGSGTLSTPTGIALDPAGNVYVADGDAIYRFASLGAGSVKKFTKSAWSNALNGAAWHATNNRVYVADTSAGVVRWLNPDNGNQGSIGGFTTPVGVHIDGSGNLYVTDFGANRIQKYSASHTLLATYGSAGSGDGQFSGPSGVGRDGSGRLCVVDQGNARVQVLSSSGAFVTKFGTSGTGDGQFTKPAGLAVDSGGTIVVSDYSAGRVQDFTLADVNGALSVVMSVTALPRS